jgi:hypothetical protein
MKKAPLILGFAGLILASEGMSWHSQARVPAAAPQQKMQLAQTQSTKPNKNSEAVQALEGEVQTVELDLQTLRDLGLDIKKVRHAASGLYEEVTRTPVTIQSTPNFIGNGTIINIPTGFSSSGAMLPPRKKAVDAAMVAMRPIITIAKEDVDAFESGRKELNLPQHLLDQLKPTFDDWRIAAKDASNQLAQLEPLTQGPPYMNESIASHASAIDKDMRTLESDRREIYKALQAEGKDAKRKEHQLSLRTSLHTL